MIKSLVFIQKNSTAGLDFESNSYLQVTMAPLQRLQETIYDAGSELPTDKKTIPLSESIVIGSASQTKHDDNKKKINSSAYDSNKKIDVNDSSTTNGTIHYYVALDCDLLLGSDFI